MTDQDGPIISGKPDERLNASVKTGEQGRTRGLLDITALIRSIQRAEGNPDCFRRIGGDCHDVVCEWRPYCLEGV
jgi:hypothetical protein